MSTSVEEETRDPQSSPTNPPILLRTGLQCPENALLALAPELLRMGRGSRRPRGGASGASSVPLPSVLSAPALSGSVALGADVTRHPPSPAWDRVRNLGGGACTPLLGRPGSWHVPSLGSIMVMGAEGMPGAHPRPGCGHNPRVSGSPGRSFFD